MINLNEGCGGETPPTPLQFIHGLLGKPPLFFSKETKNLKAGSVISSVSQEEVDRLAQAIEDLMEPPEEPPTNDPPN